MIDGATGGPTARLSCRGFFAPPDPGGADRQPLPVPRVAFNDLEVLVVDDATEQARRVGELEIVGDWVLMATFDDGTGMTAVFEEIGYQTGRVVFAREGGALLELSKSLEPTQEEGSAWYHGHAKADVLPGRPDILRDELLAGGRDPLPDEVRACFPPVRRAFFEGIERPHTFVGTFESAAVVPIYYRDVPMVSRAPVEIVAPEASVAVIAEDLWEGLVGGWLPVVRTVYPFGADECWEVTTFATPVGAGTFTQPVWYRYVRLKAGYVQAVKYVDSYAPYRGAGLGTAADFYRGLLSTLSYWQGQLDGAMRLSTPDGWVEDFSRHALVLERVTRRGDHPKYGVVDRAYAGEEHDGFQDALTAPVICALEWGLLPAARKYLDYYFEHFVRPDGTVKYRGPEMGKYGVMLSCLAQYYDYSEDYSLLREHDQKIEGIAALLVRSWEEARRLGPGDAAYGMIKGHHEADINFLTPNVHELDYVRPYLSNTAEAWRGLRDIAASWGRAGELSGDRDMAERGKHLASLAPSLLADVRRSVERSWLTKSGVEGLPIIAGSSTFYWEAPYRSCPESYDENRVWSELFHSGILPKSAVEKILAIAGQRGGTSLGIFTNRALVVGFLVAEAVQGLLQHDLVPEALLVFYAHAFHAHTRGTWTAIECVDMDRARAAHNPYCAPAQVTVPTIVKWLLVFEDPVDRTLTLAQGAPRAWFEPGKHFGVERSPTRWGPVSYEVVSHLDQGHVDAEVSLPPRPGARVRLRLRLPRGFTAERAEVLGHGAPKVRLDGDLVVFPPHDPANVQLRIWCARSAGATPAPAKPAAR